MGKLKKPLIEKGQMYHKIVWGEYHRATYIYNIVDTDDGKNINDVKKRNWRDSEPRAEVLCLGWFENGEYIPEHYTNSDLYTRPAVLREIGDKPLVSEEEKEILFEQIRKTFAKAIDKYKNYDR